MITPIDIARKEFAEEKFRKQVEHEKAKLLWPWWKKMFPYKITIKVTDLRKEKR